MPVLLAMHLAFPQVCFNYMNLHFLTTNRNGTVRKHQCTYISSPVAQFIVALRNEFSFIGIQRVCFGENWTDEASICRLLNTHTYIYMRKQREIIKCEHSLPLQIAKSCITKRVTLLELKYCKSKRLLFPFNICVQPETNQWYCRPGPRSVHCALNLEFLINTFLSLPHQPPKARKPSTVLAYQTLCGFRLLEG